MKSGDRKTFLTYEKPLLTAMVQAQTPQECKDIILNSIWDGAEAFGIQLENLKKEYRKPEILADIFASCEGKPIYVTSYRKSNSAGATDEECAKLLLMASECGATLCDIMGDYFHPEPHELTMDPEAVNKQKALIEELHKRGSEVLMSTHIHAFYPEEKVMEIAEAQRERGADVIKIVNYAETEDQLMENLNIVYHMKKTLDRKFLYLANGPYSRLLRQIGPKLGVCMYLCVQSYGPLNSREQPLLRNLKTMRDSMLC